MGGDISPGEVEEEPPARNKGVPGSVRDKLCWDLRGEDFSGVLEPMGDISPGEVEEEPPARDR